MSASLPAAQNDLVPLAEGGPLAQTGEVPPDEDAALMLEVSGDSESAFTELVRRHQQSLLNFFARMGASAECEDLAQETFIRLFRYRRQYRATARFTTFLYHLARNVWADRGRKIIRIERVAAELENEAAIDGRRDEGPMGQSLDVENALNKLSPKLRETLVLNVYQGMRYQEIADVLGVPLGTVKSRINLALSELKEILSEH